MKLAGHVRLIVHEQGILSVTIATLLNKLIKRNIFIKTDNVLLVTVFFYAIDHFLGLIGMTACTILLGVDKAQEAQSTENVAAILPLWIPLVTGFLVPIFFAINAILTKHLTSDRVGFNPSKLTYSTLGFLNIFILLLGIILWSNGTLIFDKPAFFIGMVSSSILTIGIVWI